MATFETYQPSARGHESVERDVVPEEDDEVRSQESSYAWTEHSRPCCPGASLIAKWPVAWVSIGVTIIILIIGIGFGTIQLKIDTNFASFLITDTESSVRMAAFSNAFQWRQNYSDARRLQSGQTGTSTYDLWFAYELTDQSDPMGLFSSKTLGQISKFERTVKSWPMYQQFCSRASPADQALCIYGESFIQYAVPSLQMQQGSIVPSTLLLDGAGFDPIPIPAALYLVTRHGNDELFFPKTYTSSTTRGPAQLRSLFRFRWPCCSASYDQDWHNFYSQVLVPYLNEPENQILGTVLPNIWGNINVWFEGTNFQAFAVQDALKSDIGLIGGSLLSIILYLLLHIRSPMLSIAGPILSIAAVPVSFVICGALLNLKTISFATFLALFLIVGFGADLVLVYTDYWDDAMEQWSDDTERLASCYAKGFRMSLATTVVTVVSFVTNMSSAVRALRQFGFFIGLSSFVTWMIVTSLIPPLCLIHHRYLPRTSVTCCYGGPKKGGSIRHRVFAAFTYFLFSWKRTIVALTVIGTIVVFAVGIPFIQVASGLPSMFPSGNNMNDGQAVISGFASPGIVAPLTFKETQRNETICNVGNFNQQGACAMYWCEATSVPSINGASWGGNGSCQCYRNELTGCLQNGGATVQTRFVGPSNIPAAALTGAVASWYEANGKGVTWSPAQKFYYSTTQAPGPPLLLQTWETGVTAMQSTVTVSGSMDRAGSTSSCGYQDICFCAGTSVCQLSSASWTKQPILTIPASRRASEDERVEEEVQDYDLLHPRRLQAIVQIPSVPLMNRAKVRMLFGLDLNPDVPLLGDMSPADTWSFRQKFNLADPWCQRSIFAFADKIPASLEVTGIWSWISGFRSWARLNLGRYPIRSSFFHANALQYTRQSEAQGVESYRYIWIVNNQVRALYLSVDVDVPTSVSPDTGLMWKQRWWDYANAWNATAPSVAAGVNIISSLWVPAEQRQELIKGTAENLIVLVVLAVVGMLLSTLSLAMSLFVVLGTISVMGSLLFFVVIVCQWQVGLIEAVAMIYFIGYAVVYPLYICISYARQDAVLYEDEQLQIDNGFTAVRLQRTLFAMKSIGGAAFGSCATTVWSAFFLLFCTLTLFKRLGAMCLVVTFLSILCAFFPIPAGLLLFAPITPGCFQCKPHRSGLEATGGLAGLLPLWMTVDMEYAARE